jgi:hypothetical protein
MNEEFKMKIEPRAPPVKTRLEILKRAKEIGLKTGVIKEHLRKVMDCNASQLPVLNLKLALE